MADCNNDRCCEVRCFGILPPAPLIVAATGHRRSYLPTDALHRIACAFLAQLRPGEVVSGMALGWDTAVALAALRHGISLVAAVPGGVVRQQAGWTAAQRDRHWRILNRAHVHVIGEGYTMARAYGLRDRWMVDRADLMAAWWSGSPSGTGNTLRYAEQRHVPVVNLYGL